MKPWLSTLGLLVLLLGTGPGCAGRYQITLTNNHLITTKGKPKYNQEKGIYEFKTIKGEKSFVPAIRVKTIEPIYRFDKPKPDDFQPPPQ